jgi:hypothetical protein
MTTLTNEQVVAELGWCLQIIHDSTGGRIPKFWRPPYGDVDNRVRAIAKIIFGLRTVIWNHDTEDWTLTTGGTTPSKIHSNMQKWLSGPKSPGLVILEHELSTGSVQAFIDAYPLMKSNGWQILTVADALGSSWYQNSQNDNSTVEGMSVAGAAPSSVPPAQSSLGSGPNAPNLAPTPSPSVASQTKTGGTSLHISSPSLALLIASALSPLFFFL